MGNKRQAIGEAYRRIANKFGSRHWKKWSTGIKAKHGTFRKKGKLSRGTK